MSGRYARVPGAHWRERAQEVPLAAHGLWALARSYMADNRTDGLVEEAWLVGMCGGRLDKVAVKALLDAGWWVKEGTRYRDVRYLTDNISRDKADERAAKTLGRVNKHRGKAPVTTPPDDDGGNKPRNGSGNGQCNGVTVDVTQDSHDSHDDHDSLPSVGKRAPEPEGATPLGIVEFAYGSALGEAGGAHVANPSRDVGHWRSAHAAIVVLAPGEVLRDAALRLAREYVAERRSRSPEWFAEWLQKRAASGPTRVRGGRAEPLPNSAYQGTTEAEADAMFGPRDEKAIAAIGRRRVV
jgi:hypothetical protein